MPKAYSYIRFSTPEQQKGNSFQRQSDASRDYAAAHGLTLDSALSFSDLGKSAYHGQHTGEGAGLGSFLSAIDAGKVKAGDYLLVESLDRLSRQPTAAAWAQLQAILSKGVVVVTLHDKREYRASTFDTDFSSLLISLATMYRAHDESRAKGERVGAAWAAKRRRAQKDGTPLTHICPAWIELRNGSYKVIRSKARIVERIFKMASQGLGHALIAKRLNESGAEPLNTTRKTPSGRPHSWQPSYVKKILDGRAVLGEYQPHRAEIGPDGRKKRIPDGEPIEGYFPEVIKPALWQKVQDLRQQRRTPTGPRDGKRLNNLFTRIVFCGDCGEALHFIDKGSGGGGPYLICSGARRGLGCTHKGWRYGDFEETILSCIYKTVDWNALAGGLQGSSAALIEQLEEELATVQEERNTTEGRLSNLLSALEDAKDTPSSASGNRIRQREAELIALDGQLRTITAQLSVEREKERHARQNAAGLAQVFAGWMANQGRTKAGRERLAAVLRETVEHIHAFQRESGQATGETRTVRITFRPGVHDPPTIALPFDALVALGRAVQKKTLQRLMIPVA